MDDLKKGRSTVVESEHTLILGWTDKAAGLCRELADANSSDGGGVIVVLDPLDKEELEEVFENQVDSEDMTIEGATTKVVFRSGSPLRATDLARVSATKARSIVILSDYGSEPDLADADILRILLTLQTLDGGKLNGHVVCEVRDIDNEPLVGLVGGDICETVVSHDIVGRLMLMAARQPGIARVYNSILGFDGDEFYTDSWDEIVGKTWEEVILMFPMAIPIGFAREDGSVELNPRKDHKMNPGEELIVIAEDDDTYEPEDITECEVSLIPEPIPVVGDPEKILFCGWRRDVRDMMLLLDTMVAPGSELHMFNEKDNGPGERTAILLEDGFNVNELCNMKLVHWQGNSAVKRHLQPVPLDEYSVAMILADQSRENDMMHSDSHSLSSLLLIRDLQEKKKLDKKLHFIAMGGHKGDETETPDCAVVCEILDARTQETISRNEKVSLSSDFVQSNQMISQIMAMVSEDRNVTTILGQMLGAAGATIKVTGSEFLCTNDEELSYWQLQKRCIAMDKTLLGYQGHANNEETVINPKDKEVPKLWEGIDVIFMEGHSAMDHQEKTEEILEALAKRHSPSKLTAKDMEAGPHSSPVKKARQGEEQEPRIENKHKHIRASNYVSGKKCEVDPETIMEADDALLSMLVAMNSRIGDLSMTVDNLSSRVEGIAGMETQQILMVPHRVRLQMNDRLGELHTNVSSIQNRVHALANQSQQPILMVPQYAQ